jgi:hypothetical protein
VESLVLAINIVVLSLRSGVLVPWDMFEFLRRKKSVDEL